MKLSDQSTVDFAKMQQLIDRCINAYLQWVMSGNSDLVIQAKPHVTLYLTEKFGCKTGFEVGIQLSYHHSTIEKHLGDTKEKALLNAEAYYLDRDK
jgi:hypothetical protein